MLLGNVYTFVLATQAVFRKLALLPSSRESIKRTLSARIDVELFYDARAGNCLHLMGPAECILLCNLITGALSFLSQ
jgi:hypothetical protein